jgi:hypothetical protein
LFLCNLQFLRTYPSIIHYLFTYLFLTSKTTLWYSQHLRDGYQQCLCRPRWSSG